MSFWKTSKAKYICSPEVIPLAAAVSMNFLSRVPLTSNKTTAKLKVSFRELDGKLQYSLLAILFMSSTRNFFGLNVGNAELIAIGAAW